MDDYKKRVADRLLERKLKSAGAVLIEGPKWCGKTTTAEQIAAKVVKTGRYIYFKLCSSFPYQKKFYETLNNIKWNIHKWINNEKTTIVILQLMPNNRKFYSQTAERIIAK